MIDDNLKRKNYATFLKKLTNIGIDTSKFDEAFGEKLLNGSFALTNENDVAFEGSLIHIVLRTLTPYAIRINELLPENIRANQESLVKVCLLSQISKCEMFEKNDNQWERDNRGKMFKYAPYNLALKMGMRSIILCQNLGIEFTPNELEAMIVLDRTADDKQSEFFSSPLATVLKQANELTLMQIRTMGVN